MPKDKPGTPNGFQWPQGGIPGQPDAAQRMVGHTQQQLPSLPAAPGTLQTLLQLTRASGSSPCLQQSLLQNQPISLPRQQNFPLTAARLPSLPPHSILTHQKSKIGPPQSRYFSRLNTPTRVHSAIRNARSTVSPESCRALGQCPRGEPACSAPCTSRRVLCQALPSSPTSLQTPFDFSSRNYISAKQGSEASGASATAPGSTKLKKCSQKTGFQQALHMSTSAITVHFSTNR